jgi:hypothetical protein
MSSYLDSIFPGYSGGNINVARPDRIQRGSRRVTFRDPSPTASVRAKRKSKKKKKLSPTSKFVRRVSKAISRHSPRKFKNPYIRDFGELTVALSPIIIAALYIYLKSREKHPQTST